MSKGDWLLVTMIVIAMLLMAVFGLRAQTPPPVGQVNVDTTINAIAGDPVTGLICVGNPTKNGAASIMHIKCSEGGVLLHETDYKVIATGSILFSVQRGANTITWLLTKGNPSADRWEVAANGVSKQGDF